MITDKILWDNDPAKENFPKSLRSYENNRRSVGEVFRFPVFDITYGYIKSGAFIMNINEASRAPENPKNSLDVRKLFFSEIYLPVSIPGINEPYKFVIFMPEVELEEYISQLRELKRTLICPNDWWLGEQLRNTVVSLILKMTGDTRSMKQLDNMDLAEFLRWIIGINTKGLKVDLKGISIKDILDKKKLSPEYLQKWASALASKEQYLSDILRKGSSYPNSYKVGDSVYYWIDKKDLDWIE